MALGLPSGYVRLYDEHGNAVDLAVRPDGSFGLAVQDDRLRVLLEQVVFNMNDEQNSPRELKFDEFGRVLVKIGEFDVSKSDYPVVVDLSLHKVHLGEMFFFCEGYQLASAASQRYVIDVGEDSYPNMLFNVAMGLAGTVRFYEGGDRTGSVLQDTYNRDRNSENTSALAIYKGAGGGTTDGTLIWGADQGGGLGITVAGGTARDQRELILKSGTQYILDVVSQAAANNITVQFGWYEEAR